MIRVGSMSMSGVNPDDAGAISSLIHNVLVGSGGCVNRLFEIRQRETSCYSASLRETHRGVGRAASPIGCRLVRQQVGEIQRMEALLHSPCVGLVPLRTD